MHTKQKHKIEHIIFENTMFTADPEPIHNSFAVALPRTSMQAPAYNTVLPVSSDREVAAPTCGINPSFFFFIPCGEKKTQQLPP
jgi:hypothetical protein